MPGQTRIHRTNQEQLASSITERVLGATATPASISSSHGVKVLFVATTGKVADETKHHDQKNDGNAREHDGSDGNILVAFLLIGLQSCCTHCCGVILAVKAAALWVIHPWQHPIVGVGSSFLEPHGVRVVLVRFVEECSTKGLVAKFCWAPVVKLCHRSAVRRHIFDEAFGVEDAAILSHAQLIVLARLIPGVAIRCLDRDINNFQCSIGQCFFALLVPAKFANVAVALVKALFVDEEIEAFSAERSTTEHRKNHRLEQFSQASTSRSFSRLIPFKVERLLWVVDGFSISNPAHRHRSQLD